MLSINKTNILKQEKIREQCKLKQSSSEQSKRKSSSKGWGTGIYGIHCRVILIKEYK